MLSGGEVVRLADSGRYQEGSVVSRQLMKNGSGSVTLFNFGAGEGLSEHTTPHDALVMIVDGRARIELGGEAHDVASGEAILLPGGEPHAVHAPEAFTMALVMLKRTEETP